MKLGPLWRISIATTLEAEDAASELLDTKLGLPASSFFDVKTQVSVISVYCPRKLISPCEVHKEISAGLKRIKNCGLKIGPGKIKITKMRCEDWAESWKRHFKPVEIGGALLVKPGWIKRQPRKNQAAVILDPGLSFGTGRHPTTSFCLNEVVKHRNSAASPYERHSRRLQTAATIKAKALLDLGTGSGILAIAAAKLGYKPVRAIDFDPEAVRIARANARANGVLKKIKIVRGDVTKLPAKPKEQFDLACANLISNLLIAERKKIVAQLNRGGVLVLAGILNSEFSEVQKAFENCGLKLISAKTEKEWRSGSFCFR
jgi:ribosomal protein L11 methyltransferase